MKGKRTCNNYVFPLLQPHRDSGVRHLLSPSNAAAQLVGPPMAQLISRPLEIRVETFPLARYLRCTQITQCPSSPPTKEGRTSLAANSARGTRWKGWSGRKDTRLRLSPERRRCAHRLHDQFRSCPRSSDRHRNTHYFSATRRSFG
jgi:hypothetical protein